MTVPLSLCDLTVKLFGYYSGYYENPKYQLLLIRY